jgi:hypothetical protein
MQTLNVKCKKSVPESCQETGFEYHYIIVSRKCEKCGYFGVETTSFLVWIEIKILATQNQILQLAELDTVVGKGLSYIESFCAWLLSYFP